MTKIQSIIGAVRMVKQANGYNHALGLYGTPEAIHNAFMLFSNSGVTGGELLDLGGETFAYLWTDSTKFAWYLAKWEIDTRASKGELPRMGKDEAREFFANIWQGYADTFESIPTEDFVPENATVDLACLSMGMDEKPARLALCEE